jgi:putative nucleotidyltransferase with HDIG domain
MNSPLSERERATALQVESAVLKRIESDDLLLPSLPSVVLKAMALLGREGAALADVATVIEPDPVVAARLVCLANSAALASRQPATTILHAVTRLGAAPLRAFLIEISASAVFSSRDPAINEACAGLWEHSLAVGILARDLVTLSGATDPETVYLGGLLHDIGKPIVAAMLLEAEQRLLGRQTIGWFGSDTWVRLVQNTHRRVGVALARRWQLPATVATAVEQAGSYDTENFLCATNLVRLANAQVKVMGMYVGDVDDQACQSLVALGSVMIGVDPKQIEAACDGLGDRVRRRLV